MTKRASSRVMFGSVMIVFMLIAAGCGGGSDDSTSDDGVDGSGAVGGAAGSVVDTTPSGSTDSQSADDVDPAGVLRFGTPLITGVGVHFDPVQNAGDLPNIYSMELVFGTLARFDEEGVPQPWMAEDVEIVDPRTVRITLRDGMTFTDGSAYDAAAVQTSMMRTRFESATPAILSRMDAGYKALAEVNVIDPLTVEATLDAPVAAAFVDSLASVYGAIVSPEQIAESPEDIDLNPVGAGPYMFDEYVTDQSISLSKNRDFFDADAWRLGGVEFVHTPSGPTQANALLSDALDLNLQVPIESLEAVEADSSLTSVTMPVRPVMLYLCATKAPFDDPLVREALRIGIDRQAYIDVAYNGEGLPAHGLYKEGDPSYDPEVAARYEYDPERARQLLEEAGATDAAFDLITITTHNWGRQTEVLQSQLAQIGLNANVVRMDDVYSNWIEPQAPGAMLVPVPGLRVGGYSMFNAQVVEGGAAAYCGSPGDPEVAAAIDEAVGLAPDDPEAVDLYREAMAEFADSSLHVPVIFEAMVNTWNNERVGGTPQWITVLGYPRPMLESIYMKQ